MKRGIVRHIGALMSILIVLTSTSCKKDVEEDLGPYDRVVSYEKDVQPIFNQNCISCHPASGDLSLLPGDSYDNLVNVISPNYFPEVRVKPFRADSSVVCHKLHGIENYGHLMPLNGIPLEAEEIETIEAWIDQGAKNN